MRWKVEDSPERAAWRSEFKQWLAEVLPEGWIEALEASDDAAFARARKDFNFFAWQGVIGRTGYAAPLWPKEYGGLSGETWMQQIVREELGYHRLPIFGINLLGVGLAGPTIIAHASEAQKARYLPKILSGEEIWCQLFSEPGSGSDLASLGTRAVRDGDEWVVNGQKVWTSIAQFSKFGMLLARTDPDVPKHEGLSYFVVDMHAPGVEIRPLRQITGSADFNEVFFTDVRIPDANRIGEVGEGWRYAADDSHERARHAVRALDRLGLAHRWRAARSVASGPRTVDGPVGPGRTPGSREHLLQAGGEGDHLVPRECRPARRSGARARRWDLEGLQRGAEPAPFGLLPRRRRRVLDRVGGGSWGGG